ncbi:MAG: Ig-like domain-containing protein [Clostridia bacterium]
MKKFFTAVLSFVIVISMCVPVYASSTEGWNYGEKLNYSPSINSRTYKPSEWSKYLVDKYNIHWYENPKASCLKGDVMLVQLRVIQEALKRQGYSQLSSNVSLSSFKDIGTVYPSAQDEIKVLKSFGIISGDKKGNMNLSNVATRAVVSKILTKINEEVLEMYGVNSEKRFSDVKKNHWASSYISYVYQIGLMDAIKGNKFYPNKTVSIEQMLQILEKEVGSYGITEEDVSKAMNDTFKVTMSPSNTSSNDNNKVTAQYISYSITKGQKTTIQLYVRPSTSKNLEILSYDTSIVNIESIDQYSNTVTVKGVSNGDAYIKVKVIGLSDNYAALIPIHVTSNESNNVPVTGISIYNKLALDKGQSCILTANIYPNNATNKNVTWFSDDKNIVNVDENGRITAMGKGSTVITAVTYNGYKSYCVVTVNSNGDSDVPATSISIYDKLTLDKGQSYTLTANVYPSNATNKNVIWYSDDKNIAKIDEKGTIIAMGKGSTVITAITHNGYKSYCVVTVNSNGDSNVPDYPTDDRKSFMYASGYAESSYYNAFNNEIIKFIVDTDKSISSIILANNNCTLEKSATSSTNGWQFTIKTAKLSAKGECLVSVKLSSGEVLTVNVCIYP